MYGTVSSMMLEDAATDLRLRLLLHVEGVPTLSCCGHASYCWCRGTGLKFKGGWREGAVEGQGGWSCDFGFARSDVCCLWRKEGGCIRVQGVGAC